MGPRDAAWRPTRGARVLVFCALAFCVTPQSVAAQYYGQWWWEARLGYGERSYDNFVAGKSTSGYTQKNVSLSLDFHGFLGHPALGDFTFGLDGERTDVSDRRAIDSHRLGYRLGLNLLPRGIFPVSLGLRRGSFHLDPTDESVTTSTAGRIESQDSYFVTLRPKTGWLKGAFLRHDASSTHFEQAASREDTQARTVLNWGRRNGPFDNRVSIRRNRTDFSFGDYAIEDWSAVFNQSANFADRWRWQFASTARRYAFAFNGQPERRDRDLRVLASLARQLRENDQVQVRLESSRGRPDSQEGSDSLGVSASYRRRLLPQLDASSTLQYSQSEAGTDRVNAWRGGMNFFWGNRTRSTGFSLAAGASTGTSRARRSEGESEERQTAWSLSGSFDAGEPARVRAQLEVSVEANQLRTSGESPFAPDAPPLLSGAASDEDSAQARLRLEHEKRGRGVTLILDRSRRRSTPIDLGRQLETDAISTSLQAHWRSLTLTSNLSRGEAKPEGEPKQLVDAASIALSATPFRYLTIGGSLRRDQRRSTSLPDLEGRFFDANFVFHLGQLDLQATYFDGREVVAGGLERNNKGLSWQIRRRIAGWLPIVTSVRRRGEIR